MLHTYVYAISLHYFVDGTIYGVLIQCLCLHW